MRKFPAITALLFAVALLFSSSAIAFNIPDGHLKSEAQDATLTTSPDAEKTAKNTSPLEVFVDTLLGKNIDKPPEKAAETKD